MRHQNKPLLKALLITTLLLSVQKVALSHVGHGDEFQATGGIERVQVNAQTDSMLGIVVEPIEQAAPDGVGVMIPSSAVVDANDKQLVFVQYENFYEPVEVTTGATQGDLIQVTKELSIGEKLVTQGSLSLYAESRKTQTSEPSIVSEQTPKDEAHQKADAQGIPHSHDASGNLVENSQSETTPESNKSGMGIVAAVGGGAALLIGAIAIIGGRKKKRIFSNKR
ncbi:Cation efflux system protein involved in nickel and cobalt tolerance [Gloeothece citriformis PCC 7424]|uniref:Cation efflux system protein involved in nickel and cobalt tolerance n=1 Tax=Gloeothece citriformis (strain PCC 7424) TaxID=65393 RepID=B7KIJ8_GLOC7|nr:cobalt transporter [Gloeothece citriformis]ACK69404.1 Cation efflux system protein involved in nickel and cobalt tolerance [Gloeothece citriformis PCC 7424]